MTRHQATLAWLDLVSRYGLRWTASVPTYAYDVLAEVNKVLSTADKRHALGLPR